MRKLNLYVVIDERAKTIIGPMVHDTSPVPIVREIEAAVNSPESLIGRNPEDFSIYDVGQVDEETGTLYPHETRELIVKAIVLKRPTP